MERLLHFTTSLSKPSSDSGKANNTDIHSAGASPLDATENGKIDTSIIDHILGKSDAVQMQEAMAAIENESLELSQRELAFDNLEMLVEHIDNAINIDNIGLWPRIIAQLDSPEPKLRRMAACVIATGAQNNPRAQVAAISAGALKKTLTTAANDTDAETRKKALLALSSILRHNPVAVEFISSHNGDGWDRLVQTLIPLNSTACIDSKLNVINQDQVDSDDTSEFQPKVMSAQALKKLIFFIASILREEHDQSVTSMKKLISRASTAMRLGRCLQSRITDGLKQDEDFLEPYFFIMSKLLSSGSFELSFDDQWNLYNEVKSLRTAFPELEDTANDLDNLLLLDPIEDVIAAISRGEIVLILDDHNRENEGDFVCAAQDITEEKMAFIIRYSSGYVCVPMTESDVERFNLPMMVHDSKNEDQLRTAYTVSCDYRHGTTTGISAHDRALTAKMLADPDVSATDFYKPGHILPLKARKGGVLERAGHTETSVELCSLANKRPVAVICEAVNDCGSMKRKEDCAKFAQEHGLKISSVGRLRKYLSTKWKEP